MRKLNGEDLFNFARLIKKIGVKEELGNVAKNLNGETDLNKIGYEVIFSVLEKCIEKNTEDSLWDFLAGPFEMKAKEVQKIELFELVEKIFEIADVEKWKSFLKIAVR